MPSTLVSEGHKVSEAKTGEAALEGIRQLRPYLVVLDMNMPGMGGLEACRAIRRDSNIAVIMHTVRYSEEDKVAALDAGADDFVTKPFSTPELMARIRAASEEYRARSHLRAKSEWPIQLFSIRSHSA